MGTVSADISMSLDGYIAGPNDIPEQGLGEGGERLHEWLYNLESWRRPHGLSGGDSENPANELMDGLLKHSGAIIVGRRMFDLAGEWGDEPPFHMPVFVLTHRPRETMEKRGTTFHFVTDGIESALRQAKTAAGEKNVAVGGGAQTIQQFLAHGLLDELQIHLVPVLLGDGRRLFEPGPPMEFEIARVLETPGVVHLTFRVVQ